MLELKNLSVHIGDFKVVDISLSIKNSSIHAILGPSGSGKTILVETIAGFHKPCGGRVFLEGVDITAHAPEWRYMAYVPQDLALFPHLTVKENIYFGLTARGGDNETLKRNADAIAESLYIKTYFDRNIATLSGGEKQRVALARALATGNKILLLDEPFSGLHPGLRKEFWFLLKELQNRHHLTIIIITHDLEEAFFLGDHISILIDGMVHQSAAKEKSRIPKDKTVALFYGIRNIFPGIFSEQTLLIPTLNLTLPVSDCWKTQKENGKRVDVGVRAEDLIIYDTERIHGVLNLSPEVISMPTVRGKITACFEKGHSATVIFSPINSDIVLEVEIPYHKVQKLCGKKRTDIAAVAIPPDRIFILESHEEAM
ncbi:MAG: ABC transporter ATP-binding protein [Deltaproteobacteria bacterium]|nr:ABC transporter ATP-binding protein [Deltaproteobacteria bacterium]